MEDNGQVIGQAHASSLNAMVEQLRIQGIEPLDIMEEIDPNAANALDIPLFNPWPTDDDVILFSRQMFTLVKAGVPVVRALQGMLETVRNRRFKEALAAIIADLQGGGDLSSSMAKHPNIFGQLYVRMIRIGEESGRLQESFDQLFKYLSREKETKQMIKKALRYPTMVLLAVVGAVAFLTYKVIPVFVKMFAAFGADLPWATKVLISTSNFVVAYGVYILLGAIMAVFWFRWYIKNTGRPWWDRVKLKIYIIGSIIYRATLSRFARSFAMGSKSGIPTIQILTATAEGVENLFVEGKINEMRERIERGESLLQSAMLSELFTPLVLQMISVGEETGVMDEMMEEVAEFYEREVAYDVDNLGALIEPLLLAVMAGLVLILALGIFLPMWDLSSQALRKNK
jgi:MSHA biogenesis protein MshG